MDISNKLYKNLGIHVITAIFTVENGNVKVLLIERKKDPYMGKWALVGGALYNNEELLDGAKREIYEKTGIKDINLYEFKSFSKVDRSPLMRMIAIGYVGVIDSKRVEVMRKTEKTTNADWFLISSIPELAYDHIEILMDAIKTLKEMIINTDILKELFPYEFTLPELQKVLYETILETKIDRRNFRKKLLSTKLIVDTKKEKRFKGKKPAKLYKFNPESILSKNIF